MSGPIRMVLALCVVAAAAGCTRTEDKEDDSARSSQDTVVATRAST